MLKSFCELPIIVLCFSLHYKICFQECVLSTPFFKLNLGGPDLRLTFLNVKKFYLGTGVLEKIYQIDTYDDSALVPCPILKNEMKCK